ncbi:DNA-directed DNA polymerase [Tanacetum coccineum]
MRTRNSNFPNNWNVTILRRRNRGRAPNVVEPELRTIVEVAPMAERTMEELLRAPTKGYGEAIVLPEINADHFEIKTNLLQLVQANMFHGYERENPHAHINSFKRITSTLRFRDVSNDVIRLMMFPYSLEGSARLFAPTIKSLLMNKEKFLELAKIPLNENCSAMLLKKLPEKLGDPGKFIIPCNFLGMDVCHALADLGASINLMPLSFWKNLSLPKFTPTRMTLELADRSITHPKGLAKDVFIKVGKFHFPTDFVVVDFKADPRVPLILGRSFLRTGRALIDVYGEEITLREFSQEVLGFSNNSSGGNPTSSSEPILSSNTPSLTPFEGGNFTLEEIDTFLQTPDEFTDLDDDFYDTEGYILYLEQLLNEDPSPTLPPKKNEDLKQSKVIKATPSIEEALELELKDLPSHLEYAYLEENDKLPLIIAKGLKDVEKEALLKVLKSHKRAIAWKITDIKGIDPRFCTHKFLMKDDYKPTVQSQRRVNPKIHEVIKIEVLKLLDAGMIYPISDSPWVSPVHYVPKKGGITVVANEENELILTRLVTGWRVCIDYRKLNEATRKDHFTLPFMVQMLERLAGNEFLCFVCASMDKTKITRNPPKMGKHEHKERKSTKEAGKSSQSQKVNPGQFSVNSVKPQKPKVTNLVPQVSKVTQMVLGV